MDYKIKFTKDFIENEESIKTKLTDTFIELKESFPTYDALLKKVERILDLWKNEAVLEMETLKEPSEMYKLDSTRRHLIYNIEKLYIGEYKRDHEQLSKIIFTSFSRKESGYVKTQKILIVNTVID